MNDGTPELAAAIRRMRAEGGSYHAIGRELGISQQSAWRLINERGAGTGLPRAPSAQPRASSRWPVIAAALATGAVLTTLLIAWRLRAAVRAEPAERDVRAERERAERPAQASATTTVPDAPPTPLDPHIDPAPPELRGELDDMGRARRSSPPTEGPSSSRRLN